MYEMGTKGAGEALVVRARKMAIGAAALEPAAQRRHREGRVRGQHRDDGVDVVAFPGVQVALDELADAPVDAELTPSG